MDNEEFWNDREVMSEEEAEALVKGQDYEEIEEESDPTDFMEVYEDEYEDMEDEDLQEKTNDVLDSSLIRLEQGALYKLIMETIDGGMFENTGCDDRSIKNVEREMKSFIVSRLEVLLGIRKKKVRKVRIQSSYSQQNGLDAQEVAIIKRIVGSAAKKAGVAPAIKKVSGAIKPVSGNVMPRPTVRAAEPKLPPAPTGSRRKKKKTATPVQGGRKPLTKSPYEMSDEELKEYNKHIKSASKTMGMQTVDPTNPPIAQPDSAQMEMHHQQGGNISPTQATTINTILNLMKQQGE